MFEDFLDRLGVTFDELRDEFVGSWMFGYAAALATAGVRTVIVCPTSRFDEPVTTTHEPTGAELRFLPTSRLYAIAAAQRLDGHLGGRRDPRSLGASRRTSRPTSGRHRARCCTCSAKSGARPSSARSTRIPRFDVCVAVGRRAGVPVYGTFQGADYQLSRLERPVRPRSIRRAQASSSERGRARAVEATYDVPAQKLAHDRNPVDTELWRPVDGARCARARDPGGRQSSWPGTGSCSSGARASTSCSTPGAGSATTATRT